MGNNNVLSKVYWIAFNFLSNADVAYSNNNMWGYLIKALAISIVCFCHLTIVHHQWQHMNQVYLPFSEQILSLSSIFRTNS